MSCIIYFSMHKILFLLAPTEKTFPQTRSTCRFVAGHVVSSSELPGSERLDAAGFVEPCCWCWRSRDRFVISI